MTTNEKRILIVDDDDAIRALLFTILRRHGFKVDGARNGVEALAHLRRCVYSVMLLDLMMPLKSGWDVIDELKKTEPNVRPVVIVITAGTDLHNLDPALVAATVRKPFDISIIVDTVMECTRAVAPQDQLPDCPPAESTTVPSNKVN